MTDTIEDIRARHLIDAGWCGWWSHDRKQQHDDRGTLLAEVDRQRAEIERLSEALRKTACACSSTRECPSPWPSDISGWCQHLNARMALEGKSLERKP